VLLDDSSAAGVKPTPPETPQRKRPNPPVAGGKRGARRSRRRRLAWIAGLLTLAAGAFGAWRWTQTRPRPLDANWESKVIVLAGDGVANTRDGDAAHARFADPFGVAVAADGAIYIADGGDHPRIRRIARPPKVDDDGVFAKTIEALRWIGVEGIGLGVLYDPDTAGADADEVVSTLAGGEYGFGDGVGEAAKFGTLSGLAIDAQGTLYVADTGNNAIRRITPDGRVSTIAGDGVAGYQDGPGPQARFNGPIGIAVDVTGRVIVADTYNDRLRAIAPDGNVTTIAGSVGPGLMDGAADLARFDTPCGVAIDASGRIYVADTGNNAIRIIDQTSQQDATGAAAAAVTTTPLSAVITTVSTPSWAFPEALVRPTGITIGSNGDLYITDARGRIVEITSHGATRTLAGSTPGFHDGVGGEARFRNPSGIAHAGPGRLIVADAGNALVRLVGARTRMAFRPPASPSIAPRFDVDRFGEQPLLWPIAPQEGPHEIAGTLGEARGSQGSERFHAGIDVRIEDGTQVLAVRDGIVTDPIATDDYGSLNEWLRIGAVSYVHIRAARGRDNDPFDPARFVATYDGTTGKVARIRVKRGARFRTGDVVGSVNRFNHVHLNVGWPGQEYNPLRFGLLQFEDTVPPAIARGGVLLYDEFGEQLKTRAKGRLAVSGRVMVVVDAWDQADGNRANRRLGLYDLGYQVLTPDGQPAPGFEHVRETLRFDRSVADVDAVRLVYAPGSGIPFYGGRRTRFLYVVTNTFRDGVAEPGFWDTTSLPPGNYILRAWATDISGNPAVVNRDLPVVVLPPAAPAVPAPAQAPAPVS
jgi:sugar lactone lactonase YvrE